MLEKIFILFATTMMLFVVIIFWIALIDGIFWISCINRYEDSNYTFKWWCKVNYNWEYITEKLYEKAFEQNLIIE